MIFACCLSLATGAASIVSKMINFQATIKLGTWNGSLVNYVVASILSFFMVVLTKQLGIDTSALQSVSPLTLLGGTFGIIAFLLTMITLPKMKVIHSTTLLLVGQLLAGICFDLMVFKNLSPLKILGIVVISIGIIWDKHIGLKMNF